MYDRRRKLALLFPAGMLALGLMALVWAMGIGSSEAQEGAMQNCPQTDKWAIAVWDGDDGTDASQAFATCDEGGVTAAYSIDPDTQDWSRWFVDRPDVSNLTALNNMQGVVALGGAEAPPSPTPTATLIPTPTQMLPPGMKHFSNESISFDYPEEWHEVGFTWEPGYEWGICFSAGTGDEPGVFVLTYILGDKTLKQFTLWTENIGYGADFYISTPVETTINGRVAYTYTYSGTKYGVPVKGETMIVTDGVLAYWVDCFATQAEYPQNKAIFQRIFESFIIE